LTTFFACVTEKVGIISLSLSLSHKSRTTQSQHLQQCERKVCFVCLIFSESNGTAANIRCQFAISVTVVYTLVIIEKFDDKFNVYSTCSLPQCNFVECWINWSQTQTPEIPELPAKIWRKNYCRTWQTRELQCHSIENNLTLLVKTQSALCQLWHNLILLCFDLPNSSEVQWWQN
jgi:hypothetical protein